MSFIQSSAESFDPFHPQRFLDAQEVVYPHALAEIRAGEKRSHWMWYVFPQIRGLGYSTLSKKYAIRDVDEAEAYLAHPVLGTRLLECFAAVLAVEGRSAHQIFHSPDDMKLQSCATLFVTVGSTPSPLFDRVLDKYYAGKRDEKTLALLRH